MLLCGRVAAGPKGRRQQSVLAGMLVHTAQQSGAEKIRVVSLAAQCSEGIAEACDRATVCPIELVLQVLRGVGRHAEVAWVLMLLIRIQEGVRDKGCADQV